MAHETDEARPEPGSDKGREPEAPAKAGPGGRQQRSAATLRENLRRRKRQHRLRSAGGGAEQS